MRIFLSYRRNDVGGHAGRLSDTLAHLLGAKNVFQDVTDIAAGRDFVSAIHKALDSCDDSAPGHRGDRTFPVLIHPDLVWCVAESPDSRVSRQPSLPTSPSERSQAWTISRWPGTTTCSTATPAPGTGDSPDLVAFDEELGNTWAQLAAVADADNDGRVSRDEFRAASLAITAMMRQAAEAGGPSPFTEWVATLYRVIDADGDGHITKQEYTDCLSALTNLEMLGLAADTDIDAA